MTFETLFLAPTCGVDFGVFTGDRGKCNFVEPQLVDIPYWLKTEITEWSVAYGYENIDIVKYDAEGFALAHKLKKYMPSTVIIYCSILNEYEFTYHEIE